MKLRPEYQAILNNSVAAEYYTAIKVAVEKCQELADRQPQPVIPTDDKEFWEFLISLITKHLEKPKSKKIMCRLYWDDCGNLCVWMYYNKADHHSIEKWYGEVFEVEA